MDWRAQVGSSINTEFADKTAEVYQLVTALDAKVSDFFVRCQLAAYDSNATAALNASAENYAALAGQLLSATGSDSSALPLATVNATRPIAIDYKVSTHIGQ